MLESYDDIRDRIKDPILWFDSNGVPRYDTFRPGMVPNIYADEAVLYRIECQACQERFTVASQKGKHDHIRLKQDPWTLAECVISGSLGYGDPPRHGCSGDTMSSDAMRVLEFWKRVDCEWVRDAALEIQMPDYSTEPQWNPEVCA